MTREARIVLAWLMTLIAGAVMIAFGGCTWGLEARRAYDAAARAKGDQEELEQTRILDDQIAAIRNGIDKTSEPTLYCMVEDLGKPVQTIAQLAAHDLGRARIAQLDHGPPPELEVELGSTQDQQEIVAYAGMASERQSKRIWRKGWAKKLGVAVSEFAAGLAAGGANGVREVVKALIPAWVLWLLGLALIAAVGIGLYALYQRLVVVKRAHRTIEQKDAALDEYDDFGERVLEGMSREQKEALAVGEHLRREHAPRNDRRKHMRAPISRAYQELAIHYTPREKTPEGGVKTAEDMLPFDKTCNTLATPSGNPSDE